MATTEKPKAVAAGDVPAPTRISFLQAVNVSAGWSELNPEIPADASPEVKKKAQQEADTARKGLSEYLHTVLTTPNLIILAGSGASLGKVGGPSMKDLWNETVKLPKFKEAAAAVKHPAGDEWIENLMSRCRIHGPCHLVDAALPLAHRHGSTRIPIRRPAFTGLGTTRYIEGFP